LHPGLSRVAGTTGLGSPLVTRSVLLLVAVVVIGALSAGCADDVAPAARVGDSIEITADDLIAEADEWAGSPTLVTQLQIPATEGAGKGSYATPFVDFLLTTRISFALHNAQFRKLGLELTDQDLTDVRAGLFSDPAASAAVLDELSPAYAERLVADAARQFAVSQAMADGYQAWQVEAFTGTDIEINPRYGSWDPQRASVVPPSGPLLAPARDLLPGG
jgi:hypothetical protein